MHQTAAVSAVSGHGLREVTGFGTNPGALRMVISRVVGSGSPEGGPRPLVVVLHGCTQQVATFDAASGWSRLAAQHDFSVLYAEQQRANNDQLCFSWFRPADVARTGGEAESIRQMVATAVANHGADPGRIYVCGLSAGGAMAGAMLATYPEVFAAGAVIAGIPYGAATSVGEAFETMISGKVRDGRTWGNLVRAASSGFAGSWPRVAIWHGTADRVVRPSNAGELVKQWADVHHLSDVAPIEDDVGIAHRRIWRDSAGRACVTDYALRGFGHGAPVDANVSPAPFFLPADLSATHQIAADFGLTASPKTPVQRLLSMIGLGADGG